MDSYKNQLSASNCSSKQLLAASLPIMVGMSSYTLIDLSDAILCSWLGSTELAGIGIATTVSFVFNSFFIGFFESVKIVVGQACGANQSKALPNIAYTALWLSLICGVIFSISGLWAEEIFALYGGPAQAQSIAVSFYKIRAFGSIPWFAMIVLGDFMQGLRDVRSPMISNILMCVLNVLFDILLIYGLWIFPRLGVDGSAYAQIIGAVISFGFIFLVFIYRFPACGKLEWSTAKKLLQIGIPTGLAFLFEISNWAAISAFIARMGENVIGANQIVVKIMWISILPYFGVSAAASIFAANFAGKKEYDKVREVYNATFRVLIIMSFAFAVLFLIFQWPIIAAFNANAETTTVASQLMLTMAIYQISDALVRGLSGVLNGAGDSRFTMFATAFAQWGLLLPAVLIIYYLEQLTVFNIWFCCCVEITILMLLLMGRFYSQKWKNKAVF